MYIGDYISIVCFRFNKGKDREVNQNGKTRFDTSHLRTGVLERSERNSEIEREKKREHIHTITTGHDHRTLSPCSTGSHAAQ